MIERNGKHERDCPQNPLGDYLTPVVLNPTKSLVEVSIYHNVCLRFPQHILNDYKPNPNPI